MSRSHWAWGAADKLPDHDARRALGQAVQALLALSGSLVPVEPVDIDAIVLPEPRLEVPEVLEPFTSADRLTRIHSTHGRSWPDQLRGFCGDFTTAPDLVARPRTEDEVAAVLSWAGAEGVQVVIRGGGTSVVGGVAPMLEAGFAGVLVLDTSALDQVLEVDATSQLARIQGGILGPALEAGLAPHGLTLRHYPQSFEFSTLGGWIATRAGGHFATLYTHIDDLVASIRMVTPSGIWDSRTVPGSGAGPSPDRWVLGSEGTLGVITEAWMRVRPRPTYRASAEVTFDRFATGAEAVRTIAQARLYPANCRLLSATEAMLNSVGTETTLVLGFESADHPVKDSLHRALTLAHEAGGRVGAVRSTRQGETVARGGAAGSWRKSFLQGPYLQPALLTLGVAADTFETAVTWQRWPALHQLVKERVGAALQREFGGGRLSCRFTHVYPEGPAPYYTWLAPCSPTLEYALERWQRVKQAAMEALDAAGATVTHHHAVGRLHRWGYERQRPAPFARALGAAKEAVDPSGVLNPGVLFSVMR